jgi:hypothetical protein
MVGLVHGLPTHYLTAAATVTRWPPTCLCSWPFSPSQHHVMLFEWIARPSHCSPFVVVVLVCRPVLPDAALHCHYQHHRFNDDHVPRLRCPNRIPLQGIAH